MEKIIVILRYLSHLQSGDKFLLTSHLRFLIMVSVVVGKGAISVRVWLIFFGVSFFCFIIVIALLIICLGSDGCESGLLLLVFAFSGYCCSSLCYGRNLDVQID